MVDYFDYFIQLELLSSFFFLYLHIGRGLYYGSFTKTILWNSGSLIYLLLIGTAFLGYVLPWGQISFWAATVITNLLSTIPFLGTIIVEWVWGGFAVGNPTLTRFFALHYLLPFVVAFLVLVHIFYLHYYTRSNPLGIIRNRFKLSFHLIYRVKDTLLFLIFFFILLFFSCYVGYNLIDSENFIPANSIVTPIHIQPEWYFLFAYAILRAIPNKLCGVLGLVRAVLILFRFRVRSNIYYFSGFKWRILRRLLFWSFIANFFLLTWLGRCPAEPPYILISQLCTFIYYILTIVILLNQYLINFYYKNIF